MCIICIKLWNKERKIGDKKGNVTTDSNEIWESLGST